MSAISCLMLVPPSIYMYVKFFVELIFVSSAETTCYKLAHVFSKKISFAIFATLHKMTSSLIISFLIGLYNWNPDFDCYQTTFFILKRISPPIGKSKKSYKAPVLYLIMHHSGQKCAMKRDFIRIHSYEIPFHCTFAITNHDCLLFTTTLLSIFSYRRIKDK